MSREFLFLFSKAAFKEIVNQQEEEYEDELRQLIGKLFLSFLTGGKNSYCLSC